MGALNPSKAPQPITNFRQGKKLPTEADPDAPSQILTLEPEQTRFSRWMNHFFK